MFSNRRGRYVKFHAITPAQRNGNPMMPTKRGVGKCDWPAPPPASMMEPLPVDLLLEIVACCDATSIIRCAGASKFLRSAILDPAFRRRLTLRLQAPAADGGSFDPALLFGVSYMTTRVHHIVQTPSSIQLHDRLQTLSLGDSFEPVASCGHLLLLRRTRLFPVVELRICDTTTGHLNPLPNVAVADAYSNACFLSVSDGGGSYELIVTDCRFRFQTFSSNHGHWDAVREASVPDRLRCFEPSPRVIGRTVYWLCRLSTGRRGHFSDGIIGLDIDAAEVTMTELPQGFSSGKTHLLLASLRGRLSLLVAKTGGISMWTLTSAAPATWSRQLLIGTADIVRPAALISSPLTSFVLKAFGERSGTVIVRVRGEERQISNQQETCTDLLLRLNLETNAVSVSRLHHPGDASVACVFLHETDLLSLLKKSF